ncbi:MAG: hypothetical protein AAF762_08350 [Pseudomonadota bacterium]
MGIKGSDLRIGAQQDEGGTAQAEAAFVIDVAVTENHGFQGDVSFADTDHGLIGTVAAHAYMTPKAGQRYGLFASLSDIDGTAMTWGHIGAEGMLAVGDSAVVEGRAGMGLSDVDGLDYIFVGGAVAVEASPAVEFVFHADLTEFDETDFRAVSYDTGVTTRFSPRGAPWGLYASLTESGLAGRDGRAGQTRIGLGLTMTFGETGGIDPYTRPFRSPDPVAPLVRRNLW